MSEQKTVRTRSDTVEKLVAKADSVRTLVAGVDAMRAAGVKYLPKEEAESAKAYAARVARTGFLPATGKTVMDMTGKVFAKPVVLEDDVPELLKSYAENVDLTGRHINVFAKDVFYDALQTGIGFIITDMQEAVQREDGRPATIADEAAAGLRPYLVYVPLERVLGWKSEIRNGYEVLTQFRFVEFYLEDDGPWHVKTLEQVRVFQPGGWQIWRKNDKNDWVLYREGVTTLREIPVSPVYINRTDFMSGAPPLEGLAEINVTHWQSGSDQRNILHVARVPILFGAGLADTEDLVVGAASMFRASRPDATLAYVEHSGKAIEAGRADLKDLELQMQVMGLQLLIPTPGQTATGEIRDDAKENSPLTMMVTALQDALESAFGFMAQFLKEKSGGSIGVNKDFGVKAGAGADLQLLLDMAKAGKLSLETLWSEFKRRNVLSDSFDMDTEKDRIESEAPELNAKEAMKLEGGSGATH